MVKKEAEVQAEPEKQNNTKVAITVAIVVSVIALISCCATVGLVYQKNSDSKKAAEAQEEERKNATTVLLETTKKDLAYTPEGELLSVDEVKKIAIEKAGIDADAVAFTKVEIAYKQHYVKYEIEIQTVNAEYEIDINAETGEILRFEMDKE